MSGRKSIVTVKPEYNFWPTFEIVRTDADFISVMVQLSWMIGMTVVFFAIMLNRHVDRVFCRLIGHVLEKYTFLGGRHYRRLLQIGDKLSVGEHQFFTTETVAPKVLSERLTGLEILAVKRHSGGTERFSLAMKAINPEDSLILFGYDSAHDSFKSQQERSEA